MNKKPLATGAHGAPFHGVEVAPASGPVTITPEGHGPIKCGPGSKHTFFTPLGTSYTVEGTGVSGTLTEADSG